MKTLTALTALLAISLGGVRARLGTVEIWNADAGTYGTLTLAQARAIAQNYDGGSIRDFLAAQGVIVLDDQGLNTVCSNTGDSTCVFDPGDGGSVPLPMYVTSNSATGSGCVATPSTALFGGPTPFTCTLPPTPDAGSGP